MSYTKTFAATAAAVVLAAQAANAQMSSDSPYSQQDVQQDQMVANNDDSIVPPEIRPFIGDLDIQFSSGLTFEDGEPKRTNANVNITGIECDFIEPIFEANVAQEDRFAFARSQGEQMFIDSIRELFANRVFNFNETITGNDIVDAMGADFGMLVPFDITEEANIRVHLECADYQAPPPSFTPVEPN